MTPTVQPLTARLVTRASVVFMLDLVKIGRLGRNLNDSLISLAITQANVDPVNRDPVLQRTYAGLDFPPPSELRRPISVSAVANALRLPYETVRRRVALMAVEGQCEITPRGVVVPTEGLVTPAHRAILEANSARIQAFYGELRDLGFLGPPAPNAERFPPDQPPLRAVARVSSDYMLRMLEYLTRRIGDLVQCLIWLEVLRSNTEDFTNADRGLDENGGLAYLTDAQRRPVSVAALSLRLDIPAETLRRQAGHLIKAGRCVRVPTGLIVPTATLVRPEAGDVMRDSCAFGARMFASLAPLGVLLDWEEARLAGASRAGVAVGH